MEVTSAVAMQVILGYIVKLVCARTVRKYLKLLSFTIY